MIVRLLLLLILLLFRFYDLGVRPPHHDESVNGWFVDGILNRGYYVYDPHNYHGPLFFYILTLFEKIFGRSIEALRYPTVIFGSLITFTPFLFRKWLGRSGTWIAAIFFTFSPALIFYSRYSIHETLFAFSCILFFYFWLSVRDSGFVRKNVLGLGLSLGAMACLKENFVLFGASLGVAEGVLWLIDKKPPVKFNRNFWIGLLLSFSLAARVIVLFFSGFFQDANGVPNFFKAFTFWFQTGENGNGHAKPFYYWIQLMGQFEWFALLGLFLCGLAFQKKIPRELKLVSLTSVVLWLIYSIVAYKTPWCVLAYEWGLIFVASYWLGKSYDSKKGQIWVILAMMGGLTVSVYQAYDVAYVNPDQDNHLFIYGQTYREFLPPVQEIINLGRAHPELYTSMKMQVISTFTWPLPYLLGEFKSVGYYGAANAPNELDGAYIFVDLPLEAQMAPRLRGNYSRIEVRARQWAQPMVIYKKNP